MATEFRKGDRVRLVHEGVVTGITGHGFGRAVVIDGESRLLGKGETVEVQERAPLFRPGTVAVSRLSPRTPAIRHETGWRGPTDADWEHLDDRTVGGNVHFTVVYEPPR